MPKKEKRFEKVYSQKVECLKLKFWWIKKQELITSTEAWDILEMAQL